MSLDIDLYEVSFTEEIIPASDVSYKYNGIEYKLKDLVDDEVWRNSDIEHMNAIVRQKKGVCVYSDNITHNLGNMAEACGIYDAMWRPDEHGFVYAKDIIEILESGLSTLEADPEFYSQYNSPNGWGMYEHFVPFVRNYLNACKEYPEAELRASR